MDYEAFGDCAPDYEMATEVSSTAAAGESGSRRGPLVQEQTRNRSRRKKRTKSSTDTQHQVAEGLLHPTCADGRLTSAADRLPSSDRSSDSHGSCHAKNQLRENCKPKDQYLPPCRVCNGRASGFHYGANTCDACKTFFCRSHRRDSPYQCSNGGKCDVSPGSSFTCSACRYQQCLAVGMSKDAVKTGRYSHTKRTQDTLEVKQLQVEHTDSSYGSTGPATVLTNLPASDQGICDSTDGIADAPSRSLIECLVSAFEQYFLETAVLYKEPQKIEALIQGTLCHYGAGCRDHIMFGDPDDRKRLLDIRNKASPKPGLSVSCFNDTSCEDAPADLYTASLFKLHLEDLDRVLRSLVSFAKCIPGFTNLEMHDQITLMKSSSSEVIHLIKFKHFDQNLSCMVAYNRTKDVVNLIPLSVWRRVWQDEEFCRHCLDNATLLQQLNLSMSDVALLAAITLVSPDREQLLEPELVEAIQDALVTALHQSIAIRCCHGDLAAANRQLATMLLHLPQLRTYNHRDRLLAQRLQQLYPFERPALVHECLAAPKSDV